jgi:surfeit locus 1 family protein
MREFHLFQTKYIVKISKRFLFLCVVFFILCCLLGVWQVHRYHDKKAMLTTFERRAMELPEPFQWLSGSEDELQFQPVSVEGHYDNNLIMFVQNRMHEGRLGYEVLTPMRLEGSDKLLLVDRGWLEKPDDKALPDILPIKKKQRVKGYIKFLNEYQFILGKNIIESSQNPVVMQKIDIDELSQLTHQTFYPFIVRLDPASKNGFVRHWVIASVSPERHVMYAVQWFAFAILILVGYACFSIERMRPV